MEASLSRLDATASRLEITSNGIDTRTTNIAITIEKAVMGKLEEAVKHAFAAAKNTALKSAIKAAVITSAISTLVFGIPTNLGTSYYYDRKLSVDAEKRVEEQRAKESAPKVLPPMPSDDNTSAKQPMGEAASDSLLLELSPTSNTFGRHWLDPLMLGKAVVLPYGEFGTTCIRLDSSILDHLSRNMLDKIKQTPRMPDAKLGWHEMKQLNN